MNKQTLSGQIFDIRENIVAFKIDFYIKSDDNTIFQFSCPKNLWNSTIDNYDYVIVEYKFQLSYHKIITENSEESFNNDYNDNNIKEIQSITILRTLEDSIGQEDTTKTHLNVKTQNSSFQCIIDLQYAIKILKRFNVKNFALTDINNLHSIPYALDIAKKNDMKCIPGLETHIVNDIKPIIDIDDERLLKNIDFVVIDLETNGINPYNSQIIEIGAVMFQYQHKINFGLLTNPKIKVFNRLIKLNNSDKILRSVQELTGIKDSDLNNSSSEKEVLDELIQFLGNSKDIIIVTHSDFDIGFLRNLFRQYNKIFDYICIDTLLISQLIFPDLNSYSLEKLCIEFNILEEGIKHRALDDAKNTVKVFNHLIEKLETLNVLNIRQLKNYTNISFNYNLRFCPKLILLPKDYNGLKSLYYLFSKYSTDIKLRNFRIPLSEIIKLKQNFIIGCHAFEGVLIKSFKRGMLEEEITDILKFYDYIELIPESSLLTILNTGWHKLSNNYKENIYSTEDIEKYYNILLKHVNISKLVAINHCRYLFKGDHKYLNILTDYKFDFENIKECEDLYLRDENSFREDFKILSRILNNNENFENILYRNSNIIANNIGNDKYQIKTSISEFFNVNIDNFKTEILELAYLKYGKELNKVVKDRIDYELELIEKNKFLDFYNLGRDLIKFIKEKDIILGSRGTVGCSFIAYLIGLTEVNSLQPHYFCSKCKFIEFFNKNIDGFDLQDKFCPICNKILQIDGHNLKPEIFFGTLEKRKAPDMDFNVDPGYQKEIFNYFSNLYNKSNSISDIKALRSGTILSIQNKNAKFFIHKFRENIRFKSIDDLTFDDNLASFKLRNCKLSTGQHPGALIFIPLQHDIFEFTPIQLNDQQQYITHFEWHLLEDKLIKLDILGHDDPTVLKFLFDTTKIKDNEIRFNDPNVLSLFNSINFIKNSSNPKYKQLEENDIRNFEILSRVGTFGLPEFGTGFNRDILYQIKPIKFLELIQISGLAHGKNIWVNNGRDILLSSGKTLNDIVCLRDDILEILIKHDIDYKTSFEIMEFIRKGLSYEKPQELLKYEELLRQKGLNDEQIMNLKKISYVFPKAHATAYVINAFKTAYFKYYYPLEFYVAYLNKKLDYIEPEDIENFFYINTKNLNNLFDLVKMKRRQKAYADFKDIQNLYVSEIFFEMIYRGIHINKVDIEFSEAEEFIIKDSIIYPPFKIIKGINSDVVNKIITQRKLYKIKSLPEFNKYMDLIIPNFNKVKIDFIRHINFPENPKSRDFTSLIPKN